MIKFTKYSATGNDFIMIDNRDGVVLTNERDLWQGLCKRGLSVGADGVIFVENSEKYHFHMKYLNADGGEVAMCGNGSRAISHFFAKLNDLGKCELEFSTLNSHYKSVVDHDFVWVEMNEYYDVDLINLDGQFDQIVRKAHYYSNTGVPHTCFLVDDVNALDVVSLGRKVRLDPMFNEGVNVNFISKKGRDYLVRTYERGVENETLSCGTGITACARFLWGKNLEKIDEIKFISRGGDVTIKREQEKVFLGGEVKRIYEGQLC
ncbi:diaminopimelate epimerase [Bacteriovorax sp. Seq25_V]|uniref:diaminopimelate epimerase n=1 Tax=Bacteriovorax sp. Seq25_V TaxID=1201288 RepID=UPI000389EF43|nr:diaminopimelate epimerase [Bacteriovorax sp. Seq25_V]EQC47129.1 diaminopimelate epimerase [Bacteriovorax sp. Seq25_V]